MAGTHWMAWVAWTGVQCDRFITPIVNKDRPHGPLLRCEACISSSANPRWARHIQIS